MALGREHTECAPEREGKDPENRKKVWVNIPQVRELSACSRWVGEEGDLPDK